MTNHNFKKQFGQNFLKGSKFVDKLIAPLEITENDFVLEIGPGDGAVTSRLIKSNALVTSVEIDYELVVSLIKRFGNEENFKIIHKDILSVNLNEIFREYSKGKTIKVVGSLPYNISKKIIEIFIKYNYSVLDSDNKIMKMAFLVQEEVAKSYNARPPVATFLSNWIRLYANVKKSESIPAVQFFPKPKVNGGILVIEPKAEVSENVENVSKLLRIGFSMPRKTLAKNLKNSQKWDTFKVDDTLKKLNFKDKVRPSEVEFEDWYKLEKLLEEDIS
jgi:16S rRNA (adenine1518-N6/adenine1519-N6)-dimethyltransferase